MTKDYTEPFEFLHFLRQCSDINWIKVSMELKLKEFKEKKPEANTIEQEKMIEILSKQFVWLHDLEREYDTVKKISLENNRNNLYLANQVEQLKKENEVLKRTINGI